MPDQLTFPDRFLWAPPPPRTGIADEDLTITELTRLTPGQTLPVRYRPAVMDHYVALARDADPARVQQLSDEIASRKRT
jgi:hypothetical protein